MVEKSGKRGFASMSEDRHREVSARGGAKSRGGGFAGNPDLAREAGRKGGQATAERQQNMSPT
jgi:uncharacterized protein